MSCGRTILCLIFPPLAVIDCGAGAIIWTTIGTLLYFPGVFLAFYFVNRKETQRRHQELMEAMKNKT